MNRPAKQWILSCFLGVSGLISTAQAVIRLNNPSFEWDAPGHSQVPRGWLNAGADGESPPDIQPGFFQVRQEAIEGNKFLGMVTRDNNTWEGISQVLDGWLMKDSAYVFTLSLARAEQYISTSRITGREENFNQAAILKIWGYNSVTRQDELLAQSLPVEHSDWRAYTFALQPKRGSYNQIDLMAYYATPFIKTNGNLLLDACSNLVLRSQVRDTLPVVKPPKKSDAGRPPQLLLRNPSFEEEQEHLLEKEPNVLVRTRKLSSWVDMSACKRCNITHEPDASLRRKFKAKTGKRFIGLHTYADGGYERLAQDLAYPLEKGQTYQFSIAAAKAQKYQLPDGTKSNTSVVLRVVGLDPLNGKSEILGQTPPIGHDFWYEYKFTLTPQNSDYDYIALEAYFSKQEKGAYYNGHVLLDECSPIVISKQ